MTSLALSALLGYLLGCSSMALYLSKLKKVDLRAHGSGNLGASNAMTTLGWWAGILTALHDMGKAALAMFLAGRLFPEALLAPCLAGVFAVLGHMYPFYLRFRGGKGFAAYMGMLLMLDWHLALVLMGAGVVLTLVTDYIVSATMTTILCAPLYMLWRGETATALLLCAAALPMIWKHRENFRRIREGTEIGFRKANRGEERKTAGKKETPPTAGKTMIRQMGRTEKTAAFPAGSGKNCPAKAEKRTEKVNSPHLSCHSLSVVWTFSGKCAKIRPREGSGWIRSKQVNSLLCSERKRV